MLVGICFYFIFLNPNNLKREISLIKTNKEVHCINIIN